MNNYIGIDISKTSTAVSIYDSNGKYHFLSYMNSNTKTTKKWVDRTEEFATIKYKNYRSSDVFYEQEIYKLQDFQSLADTIAKDINSICLTGKIYVGVESYSQSSTTGHLIDLVKIGTLIRDRTITKCSAILIDYTPSTLKKETCGLVYGWIQKGKKTISYETRNKIGLAGGHFQKHHMLEALYDYESQFPSIKDVSIYKFIRSNYSDIKILSKIPSPIDDIIDSFWLLQLLMNELIYKRFTIL